MQEVGGSPGNLYRATVSLFGGVEFRTVDVMPPTKTQKIVFVHPWLRDLHDPLGGSVLDSDGEWGAEAESDADAGSGDRAEDASAQASGLFTKLAHAAKRIADSPGEAKKVETAIRNVRTDVTLG